MNTNNFDHLFREEYGKLVSSLTNILGPSKLDEVENIVQDTLVKAMKNWPINGWPDNPGAWLRKVAKTTTVDFFRKNSTFEKNKYFLSEDYGDKELNTCDLESFENFLDREILDDQLRMIFLTCHPSFSPEDRIILSLKTVAGLSVNEIASALLKKSSAIAQKIVRLKQKIKNENIKLIYPSSEEVESRVNDVLRSLYLMFNEGHKASSGENLYNISICKEATRLLHILIRYFNERFPKANALMALFLFQTSRFSSRLDENSKTILLKNQDRTKWDWEMITLAFQFLEQAMTSNKLSSYHLEAGISAIHCSSKKYSETNWKKILEFYDILIKIKPNPVISLNRAIAYAEVHGVEQALIELEKIKNNKKMVSYYYLDATFADFYSRLGENSKAINYYEKVLQNVTNDVEKTFIETRIKELSN